MTQENVSPEATEEEQEVEAASETETTTPKKKKTTKKANKPPADKPLVVNILVEPVLTGFMPVVIGGPILVAKPVDPTTAKGLSIFGPNPPKWVKKTNAEKEAEKKRLRANWKLGKKGHYQLTLDQLRLSTGRGYGISAASIMRAIQTANKNTPSLGLRAEQLNAAIKILPTDVEKNLLKVTARKGPFMKEDAVRVGHKEENNWKGTPSWTVRPCWLDWKISFELRYLENLIEAGQVYNLLMWAGRYGILEGRSSKGSGLNWGDFTVLSAKTKDFKIG